MHEQPPQRRAALARCTHGREGDGADCKIEISRGRDDGSVVAAELKDRTGEAGGETWADVPELGFLGRILNQDSSTFGRIQRGLKASARPALTLAHYQDGFHTTESPQTKARAAFQDHTATGKLKAEMTPQTPSGCQVSIIRWSARSVAMVRP